MRDRNRFLVVTAAGDVHEGPAIRHGPRLPSEDTSLPYRYRRLTRATRVASGFVVIVLLGQTQGAARADPTPDPQGATPTSLPSIGRFEIVQGVGRYPPLMLDTSSGTTWSLVPSGEPNGYGWARVETMDASEAAEARGARGRGDALRRAIEAARSDRRFRD